MNAFYLVCIERCFFGCANEFAFQLFGVVSRAEPMGKDATFLALKSFRPPKAAYEFLADLERA